MLRFINKFISKVANKHAPLRKKTIRGNHAYFVNKELHKAIFTRSRLRNKMCQNPISENINTYKKQRNKCVSLRRQYIKQHLAKITEKCVTTNKEFWNFIKPFVTNKGFSNKNNDIILKNKKKIINDEKKLANLFNSHYINIVEIGSGIKPETISSTCHINDADEIQHIVNLHKDHPRNKQIKEKIIPENNKKQVIFSLKPTTIDNVKKLLSKIDTKKAVGIDTIPRKLIKMVSNFSSPILTTAINSSVENNVFPENTKVATVVPLDKGKPDKNDISNFRPVSLLNTFSKFCERVIKGQLVLSMENYFSPLASVYRKNYSTQHVITHLAEEWLEHLDENFVVGAVLTDMSKAFDCIARDLLIAKLAAYCFSDTALRYVYSYLSNCKQCVYINNTYSNYQKIIFGLPQ